MASRELNSDRTFRFNAVVTALLMSAGTASATGIDVGNPDLKVRLDTTVRYTLGTRTEAQDPAILGNPGNDESDGKFKRGDIITNRLDLFSELDVNYKNSFGARVSAAGWYDAAYSDQKVTPFAAPYTSSYYNNTYNSKVKRFNAGPSGEVLDAFVWGNLVLGEVPVNVKVGRHAVVWGEGLLLGAHAVSYSQAPVDGVKASVSPGVETKEVFLPIGQVSAKAQVTSDLSVAGQYFFEWKNTRGPDGGTYFAGADTAQNVDRLWNPLLPAAAVPGQVLNRASALQPGNTGNWGVMAKLNVPAIESTLGAYFRRFNDYQPSSVQSTIVPGGNSTFRFVYPQDITLYGLSFARAIGPVSFGSEVSVRKNAALQASTIGADGLGPRGDTAHVVVNGIYLLPSTPLWDSGNLIVEMAYNRLLSVNTNPNQFKGEGYAGCPAGQSRVNGCSSKQFAQIAVNLTPAYYGVFPSWDVEVPISINYGLKGVSPNSGGGAERALSWSLGLKGIYDAKHEFSLRYADIGAATLYGPTGLINGGRGAVGMTDRGWLSFTYKTSF